MRKLGSTPTQNWTRQAAGDSTGYWNKETGAVWIASGTSTEGAPVGELIHEMDEAYMSFAVAGYQRMGDLGPTSWDSSTYQVDLSRINVVASVERTAAISWSNGGTFSGDQWGQAGGIGVTITNPMGSQHFVSISENDDETTNWSDTANSMDEAKALAEGAIAEFYEFGSWQDA